MTDNLHEHPVMVEARDKALELPVVDFIARIADALAQRLSLAPRDEQQAAFHVLGSGSFADAVKGATTCNCPECAARRASEAN